MSKVFVGSLSFKTTEERLFHFFSRFGAPTRVQIVTDHATERSRGFAFVEFDTIDEAEKAVAADGMPLDGRKLRVEIAEERNRTSFRGDR